MRGCRQRVEYVACRGVVTEGLSNKQIADRPVISRRTVDGHVERILRKLDVGSRTQVAAWVIGQTR